VLQGEFILSEKDWKIREGKDSERGKTVILTTFHRTRGKAVVIGGCPSKSWD